MEDEVRVIPVDPQGKYIIEIPVNISIDPEDIAKGIHELMEGDAGFMILTPGIKLIRVDSDDLQET